jgi:hypothetical protein
MFNIDTQVLNPSLEEDKANEVSQHGSKKFLDQVLGVHKCWVGTKMLKITNWFNTFII